MTHSFERLKRVADLQDDMKEAYRNREVIPANPYQAVELKQLTKDVQAAFGPTLMYMKGMDPYA